MSINFYFGGVCACSALLALGATPVVVQIARRWGIVDLPGARKVHQVPTPRIGGLAIAFAMMVSVIPIFLAVSWGTGEITSDRSEVATMLLGGAFVLAIGLIDDICNISARIKLLVLIIAAVAFCSSGGLIRELNVNGHYAIPLGLMAWPITIIWFLAVAASMNFIDGLDGLAAGIAAITCGVLAIGAAIAWHVPVLLISLSLLGSLLGFLFYNFSPARVFMGDCGSMFIGFMLAACGVLYTQKATSAGGLLLPAMALAIPFLDLLLTVVRRTVLQRRSIFSAERGHIHHRLLDLGLRHSHAVLILYMATAGSAAVGLMSLFKSQWIFYGALVLLVPALLFLFRAAGSVRGRETLAAVRRNRAIGREMGSNQRAFEEMQLRFRNVKCFADWWEQVCVAAEMLGLVSVAIPLKNRDATTRIQAWRRSNPSYVECAKIKASLPINHRRPSGPIDADVEVAVNTTLESAGRRLALFSRLMGEYSLASLGTSTQKGGGKVEITVGADLRRRRLRRESKDQKEGSTQMSERPPRVAIVHDFLYTYAGAERVLEQMFEVFPDAELFSLFDFLAPEQRDFIRGKQATTSFIQKLPFARARHRAYLPLMPLAIEQLDVSNYDIVISSSYCVAKGVLTRPDQLHICYCHSPMRFAWDLQHQYLSTSGLVWGLKSLLARVILHYARTWDARSANGVDLFVSNSDFVGRRIQKVYRRQSVTIYPPVDVDTFKLGNERSDFYVTASRMVPYKRMDLIVEAFSAMPERHLIVIGDGPEMEKIRAKAGPNVKLVGHQPLAELRRYLQLAKAFVFAAEEDFGICVVEAQACGTPVIAFGSGGAAETVVPGVTGVFFDEQSVESLMDAVEDFEAVGEWDTDRIRQNAERFSQRRFRSEFEGLVKTRWERLKMRPAIQRSEHIRHEAAPEPAWSQPIGLGVDDVSDVSGAAGAFQA